MPCVQQHITPWHEENIDLQGICLRFGTNSYSAVIGQLSLHWDRNATLCISDRQFASLHLHDKANIGIALHVYIFFSLRDELKECNMWLWQMEDNQNRLAGQMSQCLITMWMGFIGFFIKGDIMYIFFE